MSAPRVVHVNDVAVAGDTVLLRGYAAWVVAEILARVPGGLEALLARNHVSLEGQATALRAEAALREIGGRWRLARAAAASVSGNETVACGDGDGPSGRGISSSRRLMAREAAAALGISDRQVRNLAASSVLRGDQDSSGRWSFEAAAVESEVKRRREMTA